MLDTLAFWFLTPFEFPFMRTALGVSAFVGAVCAVLSCFLVLKGWALLGDALSHAVLPGVAFAYLLGLPFAVGAFVSGLAGALAIGWIKRNSRVKEDAVMGLVFTAFFALGLIVISRTPSTVHLTHILYGNVLGIERDDVIQTLVCGGAALAIVAVLRRDLMLFCFDPSHARAIGLNTALLHYTLLAVLALTVVAALQAVGLILVIAMLITPGATASLLTQRFDRMLPIAVAVAVAACVIGVYASYALDASTGGCIVVAQALIFFGVLLARPGRRVALPFLRRRPLAVAGQTARGGAVPEA